MIEDNKDFADSLISWYSQHEPSYDIDVTHTCAEGLHFMSNNEYDVIIMDIRLPDSSIHINRKITEIKVEKDLPIIVLTGLNPSIRWSAQLKYDHLMLKKDFKQLAGVVGMLANIKGNIGDGKT
jgi:CheY-like chemotaxis protein